MSMNKKLLEEFENPGSEYRGAPFWAWNGEMDPEELRRQVRVMHRMGLGGFFMHSRVGLATEYLSDDWFECIEACVDEAEKLGMRPWLYDEDRWPSGSAGGLVTRNPDYSARSLRMKILDKTSGLRWKSNVLSVYRARLEGGKARDLEKVPNGSRPGRLHKDESLLVFSLQVAEPSDWFNGRPPADTMNPAAVREFIRITHEAYRKRLGKRFGSCVPGIFTDEPHYGMVFDWWTSDEPGIPWTGILPSTFKKRYGYDIVPRLPEIFLDVEGCSDHHPRYHYFDCITHLFVESCARQTGEWCGKHGVMFTGHVIGEDTLVSQSRHTGSPMRFYEHMQAPGMDLLTEHWREVETAKQVTSAARQFGRKWRLTETYGCTGWDFPFIGHKAVGDWHVAMGINFRCQHLAFYSMEGEAKRDFPASISYQSPWWESYSKVEDYFARLNAVLVRGREVRDLLVLNPNESVWTFYHYAWCEDPRVEEYNRKIRRLRDLLLGNGIDFDYGDEEIMSRHGSVTKRNGSAVLRVGKAEYRAVVAPNMLTIRGSTLALLRRFRKAGGVVVFSGKVPALVDAGPCNGAKELAADCIVVPERGSKIIEAVEPSARRIEVVTGTGDRIATALHLLREDTDGFYLFVCNSGHSKRQFATSLDTDLSMARERRTGYGDVRVRGFKDCDGQPLELDPDTGAIYKASAKRRASGWEIRTSLEPVGSRLFYVPKRRGKAAYAARPRLKTKRVIKLTNRKWDLSLSDPNCLVLDTPRCRINGEKWHAAAEILRVDRAVRDNLGIARRGGEMIQPWARKIPRRPRSCKVTLRYSFEVATVPGGELCLAVERPDTFTAELNGQDVNMDAECGWWCDRSLRKIPLDAAVIRKGRNELVLVCDYDEMHPGLEIVYLLGNFGVTVRKSKTTIVRQPTTLEIGNWVKQGLAFYSGSVCYSRMVNPRLRGRERLVLVVPEYRGTAVRVLVDGRSAGIIAWHPQEIDLTDFIHNRPARLGIEVIGHRRNSHGPLHEKDKRPIAVGPGNYNSEGDNWTDSYQLVPCGLMAEPRLEVRGY